MNKYHITIYESTRTTYEVFAESESEAMNKYYDTEDYKEIDSKTLDYDDEIEEVS